MASQALETCGAERPTKRRKVIDAQYSGAVPPRAEKSRLLALSPELRNLIYEFALTAPGDITVTAQLRQPPLLQVCRSFRHEARNIFYILNTFRFDILDCNARLLAAWTRLANDTGARLSTVRVAICGQPNWSNLLWWCEQIYEESLSYMMTDGNEDKFETVVGAAHAIACRHSEHGWDWSDCERMLETLRTAVGIFEPLWLQ